MQLTEKDYADAANRLNVPVKKIKAIAIVESSGKGFTDTGKVVIRFERHVFQRYTKGKYNTSHPHLSAAYSRNFRPTVAESWANFLEAAKLNAKAAVLSTSWGKFQIMGFNYTLCGFTSLGAFVKAMELNEGEHLKAFISFVENRGLEDELQRDDMNAFFKGFNGSDYLKNGYPKMYADALKSLSR